MAATETRRRPRTGYLATPLTREEQKHVAQMYRQHQGLIKMLGRRMCRKYRFLADDDIYSCIDTAFIKTCRAWDPARGAFSTLLAVFCEGDVLHFIRDGNWAVKAPGAVRGLGQQARRLLADGYDTAAICARLAITREQLKLALIATQPTDHEMRGFDLHVCPRPNPWEMLEASETAT